VNFLIDTHILLWMLNEPERLTTSQQSLLKDPDNFVVVSTISLCEIGIKYATGKLRLPTTPELFFPPHLQQPGMELLPVLAPHGLRLHQLPLHHRDPFDRILISQAIVEKLPLMTADAQFASYDVNLLH
jgi:PIN domain nuclease of toxin-antitoxin system